MAEKENACAIEPVQDCLRSPYEIRSSVKVRLPLSSPSPHHEWISIEALWDAETPAVSSGLASELMSGAQGPGKRSLPLTSSSWGGSCFRTGKCVHVT